MLLLSTEDQCDGESNIDRFAIGRTRLGGELGGSRNGEEGGEITMVLREAGVTAKVTVAWNITSHFNDSRVEHHLPLH